MKLRLYIKIFGLLCEVSNGLLIRNISESGFHTTPSNRTQLVDGGGGRDVDALDGMFRDDGFFNDFDRSLVANSATTVANNMETTAENGKLDLENVSPTDCATTNARSFFDTLSNGGGDKPVESLIAGLFGWSTQQISIYPIIMILLAGFVGIAWSFAFGYLYYHFFTGGGYFGGGSGNPYPGTDGYGEILNKFKGKNKFNTQSSSYGRSWDDSWGWDYSSMLTNMATFGIEQLVNLYEVKSGS